MIDLLSLSMALAVGQGPAIQPEFIPAPTVQQRTLPNALPVAPQPRAMPSLLTSDPPATPVNPKTPTTPTTPMTTPTTPTTPMVTSNGNGGACTNCEEKKEEEAEEEEKFFFMKALENTPLGQKMAEKRLSVTGWTAMSYTASHNVDNSNGTVVWNDRANKFLLQQNWLRIEKALDKESDDISFGFRADVLYGTDYRFTLPRGLFNSQLVNSTPGEQNLYGVDPIQFYINAYLPNVAEGMEIRVGRLYTPFGTESVEAVSTPLMSRSYAFNWSPPFTHMGISFNTQLTKQWSSVFMLANGNDVFLDNSQEFRFVGNLGWVSEDENTSATFGYSLGRGKFNAGDPFAPSTISLMSENAGRNNINVLDLVVTRKITECFTYGFEAIYGWQYGVPTTQVVGAIPGAMIKDNATHGTAHWGSLVNYFTYKFNEKTTGIVRSEVFDDFEGQRTGFEGMVYAITGGVQFRPTNWMIFRPEIRWDYSKDSFPFEGNRQLLTAGADLIIRW